jgi:hypothetical protein
MFILLQPQSRPASSYVDERRESRYPSADDAGEDDDDHCTYRRGGNPAAGLIADAEVNSKALQKKAA